MKKVILLVLITTMSVISTFSVAPKYFGFELGSGGAYNVSSGVISTSNVVGFSYTFNDMFRGGFNFNEINGNSIKMVNISIVPAQNVTFTMYTGSVVVGAVTSLGFGIGLGYDFFTNSNNLFTSMGAYFDWYASNANTGTAFSIADGGVIAIGLKTRVGI